MEPFNRTDEMISILKNFTVLMALLASLAILVAGLVVMAWRDLKLHMIRQEKRMLEREAEALKMLEIERQQDLALQARALERQGVIASPELLAEINHWEDEDAREALRLSSGSAAAVKKKDEVQPEAEKIEPEEAVIYADRWRPKRWGKKKRKPGEWEEDTRGHGDW